MLQEKKHAVSLFYPAGDDDVSHTVICATQCDCTDFLGVMTISVVEIYGRFGGTPCSIFLRKVSVLQPNSTAAQPREDIG
jgi:hypothetical protein